MFRRTNPRPHKARQPFRGLEQFLLYLLRFKLTGAGKALVIGGWIAGAIGSASVEVPVFQLFFALFLVGLTALLVGFIYRPRLQIRGRLPDQVGAHQILTAILTVTNTSRLPAYDVALGLFGIPWSRGESATTLAVPVIRPGEQVEVPLTFETGRRGRYALPPLRAYSTFPFGICRAGAARMSLGSLLVLPTFHPLREIMLPPMRRYQPGGIALTGSTGDSTEYVGDREYREGDPTRKIDFRAWARLAKPAIKEFQEEYYSRVALVLDTFVGLAGFWPKVTRTLSMTGWKGRTPTDERLEIAVSLTAGIAENLSRGESVIDLFAAGPRLFIFRTGRHISHFENVLETLACVEPCPSNPFAELTPAVARELRGISAMIAVLLDWDEWRRELVRTATEAGCRVKAFVVKSGETTLPVDEARQWSDSVIRLAPDSILQGEVQML